MDNATTIPRPGFMPPPGYMPPPAAMPPPGFMPPPTYDQPGVVYVGPTQFGSESQRMTCPHCRANISTRLEREPNMKTHLFAGLFCITGLWCCVCVPYCMDTCMATKHYCSNCNTYLGEQF